MLRKLALSVLVCALMLTIAASAQSLFVSSGDGLSSTVYGFRADPLTGPYPFVGPNNIMATFPAGNRYYVVGRSGSGLVSVVDANTFALQKTLTLGTAPQAVAQTPDGRKFLVLTTGLRIFDMLTDAEATYASGDVGLNPVDVAASYDSRRAFVLSTAAQRLTTIDVATNNTVGAPISIASTPVAVSTSPNGLVYVSALNAIYEYLYDPISGSLVYRTQIPFSGYPGKLVFSPDGTRAAAINLNASYGNQSSVFVFDMANRNYLGAAPLLNGLGATKLVVPDSTRCFALVGTQQKLYQIPFGNLNYPTEVSFGGVSTLNAVRDMGTSIEVPAARYLYVSNDVYVYRFDLNNNAVSGQIGISGNRAGELSVPLQAYTGTAANMYAFNTAQTVPLGGTTAPLGVRVVDYSGKPVANAYVTFTAVSGGVTLSNVAATTGIDGFAATSAVVPAVLGTYQVTASVQGVATQATFTLTASGSYTGGGGSTTSSGLQIWAGHGQVIPPNSSTAMNGQEQLKVRYTDASGNPVANQPISWIITSQDGTTGEITNQVSLTDSNGFATCDYMSRQITSISYLNAPIGRTSISASSGYSSVVFNIVTIGSSMTTPDGRGFIAPQITPSERHITVKAGSTLSGAIRVLVLANGSYPLPGVSLRLVGDTDTSLTSPTACSGGIVLTDASGVATCDVTGAGSTGENAFTLIIGGSMRIGFVLEITAGDPAKIKAVAGDNQVGRVGQRLPMALSAQVTDAYDNDALPGTSVTWEVPVAGSATLVNTVSTVDYNSRVSTNVVLGNQPGDVKINLRVGSNVYTFTATAQVNIGGFKMVSGDGQIAPINTQFTSPVVVRLTDTNNAPITNYAVNFDVLSGSATLSSASAQTDASGNASVNVTAGGAAGAIQIRASVTGQTAIVFNLTVRLPGPVLDARQIVNAAGNSQGVVPGSLVTIYGAGIAPSIKGSVTANGFGFGPLPYTLAGVDVTFGTFQAPILSVNNNNGQESVTVQVPAELAAPAITSLTVRVSGGSTTINNVQTTSVNPGIFEVTDANTNQRYALLIKEDGSQVTSANPARRGDKLKAYVTGLGAATPSAYTNRLGAAGQVPVAPLVVGVNNEGLDAKPVVVLSPTLVGVWEVTFQVNATTAVGVQRPFSIGATGTDGRTVYSNPSAVAAIN